MASVKLHKLSGQTAMITPVHDADRTAEGIGITKEMFADKYLLKKLAPIAWGDRVPVPLLNNKRLQLLVARKHGESQLPMDAFERVPDPNRFAGFCDFCWFNSMLSRRTPTHRLVAEGLEVLQQTEMPMGFSSYGRLVRVNSRCKVCAMCATFNPHLLPAYALRPFQCALCTRETVGGVCFPRSERNLCNRCFNQVPTGAMGFITMLTPPLEPRATREPRAAGKGDCSMDVDIIKSESDLSGDDDDYRFHGSPDTEYLPEHAEEANSESSDTGEFFKIARTEKRKRNRHRKYVAK